MINCKINNQLVIVKEGTKIIEAADKLKIPVPRFCYHPKLTVAPNCRSCLVEVINVEQLLPACATEIQEGMQIFTNSYRTINSQKSIIELLLINHPLDCPICDQAGECELQNLSLQFGKVNVNDDEHKRVIKNPNLGPLIEANMNRCIYCTRCIRFEEEIVGVKELALLQISRTIKITTVNDSIITSEMSGNMIDLCPVGALNAKPLGCETKSWELRERFGVSIHDCIGSNINYHINYNEEIKRAVAKENNQINYVWLSDRDRFGFLGINNQERLRYPLIKKNNKWYVTNWEEALEFVNQKLNKIIHKYGGEQLGTLISASTTLEEGYALQKFLKLLGSYNIDHRLRQIDFKDPAGFNCYPYLGIESIENLSKQKFILLVGSFLNKEQPIAAMHVRKAVLNGCKVVTINPAKFNLNFNIYEQFINKNADLVTTLLQIIKALLNISNIEISNTLKSQFSLFDNLQVKDEHLKIAEIMLVNSNAKANYQSTIILGSLAISHPEYSKIIAACQIISWLTKANFGSLSYGANSLGMHLVGCIPEKSNSNLDYSVEALNAGQMLQNPLKGYILYSIEPELDCAYGINAVNVLKNAELVISFTAYESELLMAYSDILLPIAVPQESGGTYVNVTGDCQQFKKISTIIGESKTGIEILNKISNDLGFDLHFNYNELIANIKEKIDDLKKKNHNDLHVDIENFCEYEKYFNYLFNNIYNNIYYNINKLDQLIRIAPISLYAVDPIVRRSNSLQQTLDAKIEVIINPTSASYLNLHNNQLIVVKSYNNKIFQFPIKISSNIPEGCILINQVNINTVISIPYEKISIEKAIIENVNV